MRALSFLLVVGAGNVVECQTIEAACKIDTLNFFPFPFCSCAFPEGKGAFGLTLWSAIGCDYLGNFRDEALAFNQMCTRLNMYISGGGINWVACNGGEGCDTHCVLKWTLEALRCPPLGTNTTFPLAKAATKHAKMGAALDTHLAQPTAPAVRQIIPVLPGDNLTSVLLSATPGDTLLLANGTYLLDQTLNIEKNITIAAQTIGQATLDGQRKVRVLDIIQYNIHVKLVGLHITNGYGYESSGGGVSADAGTVTIDSCDIYFNTVYGSNGGGLNIYSQRRTFITASKIHDNTCTADPGIVVKGGGIFLGEYEPFPTIDDASYVYNNKPDDCFSFSSWTSPACGRSPVA